MKFPFSSTSRSLVVLPTLAVVLAFSGCKSATPAAATDDATLSTALHNRISGDSALSSESIQTSVQNGIATLNGTVSNEAARSLAASDAAQIAGIKTVVNNLTVQAPPAPVAAAAPPPEPAAKPVSAKRPSPKAVPVPAPSQPAPIERAPAVAQSTPPPATAASAPAPPPAPAFRNVTIPAGTTIPVRITQTLDSGTTQQGESFSGTVATDIMADGLVAIRQGTAVNGRVSAVQEAAHYKGSSLLSIELVSINRHGDSLSVSTEPYTVEGKGRGKNTAEKVGGGAAVGAILGGILGGGKGAAIGAASGGALGAGANTVTRGQQVKIPSESLVNFKLTNTLVLRASTSSTLSTTGSTGNLGNGQRRPMNPPDQSQPPQ